MNFKSLFRVCVLAAMLLPIEAACSLSARPKGKPAADREYDPQTTASFFYTEGIKNNVMEGDTARSIRLFEKVLAIDSTHAPSLYELAILYAAFSNRGIRCRTFIHPLSQGFGIQHRSTHQQRVTTAPRDLSDEQIGRASCRERV